MTNRDKLNNLTNEQLADWLYSFWAEYQQDFVDKKSHFINWLNDEYSGLCITDIKEYYKEMRFNTRV